MVDSPTPTVPMVSDSTTWIFRLSPMARLKTAAVIHPAVPPPTTTTRLMRKSVIAVVLAIRRMPAPRGVHSQHHAAEIKEARRRSLAGWRGLVVLTEIVREPVRVEPRVHLPGENLTR